MKQNYKRQKIYEEKDILKEGDKKTIHLWRNSKD